MVHNLEEHHVNLLLTDTYGASPGFLSAISWEVENSGHIIVSKESSADTIITVVSHIIDHHFFVKLNGNYLSDEFGDLSTVKFLCHLAKLNDTPFEEDFDKTLQNLEKVQVQVAGSPNCVNFIVVNRQTCNLHFTRNIFEKWVRQFLVVNDKRTHCNNDPFYRIMTFPICFSLSSHVVCFHFLHLGDRSEVVDERTEHWPIKENLHIVLNQIKYQFAAKLLPVYVDDCFIKPSDIHKVMKGALVEVQFELCHYCIQKKKVDSYNTTVQQVLVLKPGMARPASVFKQPGWNVEDSPVQPYLGLSQAKEHVDKAHVVEEKQDGRGAVPMLELHVVSSRGTETQVTEQCAESSAQGGAYTSEVF